MLYLRDLKEDGQKSMIRDWERKLEIGSKEEKEHALKLLEAVKKGGVDIQIGNYFDKIISCEVV